MSKTENETDVKNGAKPSAWSDYLTVNVDRLGSEWHDELDKQKTIAGMDPDDRKDEKYWQCTHCGWWNRGGSGACSGPCPECHGTGVKKGAEVEIPHRRAMMGDDDRMVQARPTVTIKDVCPECIIKFPVPGDTVRGDGLCGSDKGAPTVRPSARKVRESKDRKERMQLIRAIAGKHVDG